MRNSDELFQLIKSLSKSERRYFKLQTSLYGGEKKYLLLFDAIDAQENYDEAALKERFKKEKFVRQFNVAKKYLYDQILKILRFYHVESGTRAEIRELINNMEILFEKGLVEQAQKMFEKALAMAVEHEEFLLLLEVLDWMERMRPGITDTEEGIAQLYGEILTTLDRFHDVVEQAQALRKVTLPIIDRPRTQHDLDEIRNAVEQVPEGGFTSRRAEYLYCWSHASYQYACGNYQESLRYVARQVELFETSPKMIETWPDRYVGSLSNLMVLQKRTNDWDAFRGTLEKLRCVGRSLLAKSGLHTSRVGAKTFTALYLNQLNMHLAHRTVTENVDMLREIEEGLLRYDRYLSVYDRLKFHYNLTLAYFDTGDFRRALHFNIQVLNMPEPRRGEQTYYDARILNLIIHFELENTDLLDYLIKSTYRYFRSRNIIYQFERIVLDFFRKLPRLHTRQDLVCAFISLRNELEPLLYDPLEQNCFRSFGYIDWLDAKIERYGGIAATETHLKNLAA